MASVGDWIVANRDKVEKGMEVLGGACEVLASTVGQLNPILETVLQVTADLLKNTESTEAQYLVKQIEKVNENINRIEQQVKNIQLDYKKVEFHKEYFECETHIKAQFEEFVKFIKSKPQYIEGQQNVFIGQFKIKRDEPLQKLYEGIMGSNRWKGAMLDTILVIEKKNRRKVEAFCAFLKRLFVMGLTALIGFSTLAEGKVKKDIMEEWKPKMVEVEMCMKKAVDECINNFATQAKLDTEDLIKDKPPEVSKEYAEYLLDPLKKKYDWIHWSIRSFRHKEKFFIYNMLAGSGFHAKEGANHFHILSEKKIHFVVSFCINPPKVKPEILEKIEDHKLNEDMMTTALLLHSIFPKYLVHTVSYYKEVVEVNNFEEDAYYFDKYGKAYLCIHPQ